MAHSLLCAPPAPHLGTVGDVQTDADGRDGPDLDEVVGMFRTFTATKRAPLYARLAEASPSTSSWPDC